MEESRNIDEALALERRMELEDKLEAAHDGIIKMSVIEYAKARSRPGNILQPQLLYYYIRKGYIQEEPCICGRKVIDVKSADEYLATKKRSK